jgi:hypothetical protein
MGCGGILQSLRSGVDRVVVGRWIWHLSCNSARVQTKSIGLGLWIVIAYLVIFVIVSATLLWPIAAAVSISGLIAGTSFWRRLAVHRSAEVRPIQNGKDAITEGISDSGPPETGMPNIDSMGRDLALAAEHVHSIRCLLEIARQHQQPIPTAALKNLELVSKQLWEMRRRIGGRGEDVA